MSGKKSDFQLEVQKAIESVRIDPDNIRGCMIEQPSVFAMQASRAALLRAALKRNEMQCKVMEAETSIRVRKEMTDAAKEGGPKVTEGLIESATRADANYVKMLEETENIRQKSFVLDAVVEALRQRADMMVQIGADLRAERNQNNRAE